MKTDPKKLQDWKRRSAKKAQDRAREKALARIVSNEPPPPDPIPSPEELERQRARREAAWAKRWHSREFLAWIHSLPCSVPGCHRGGIEAAHAKSQGAGGTWEHVIPLCNFHHRWQHQFGVLTFEMKWGIRMLVVASVTNLRWLARAETEQR